VIRGRTIDGFGASQAIMTPHDRSEKMDKLIAVHIVRYVHESFYLGQRRRWNSIIVHLHDERQCYHSHFRHTSRIIAGNAGPVATHGTVRRPSRQGPVVKIPALSLTRHQAQQQLLVCAKSTKNPRELYSKSMRINFRCDRITASSILSVEIISENLCRSL
jgi:hypothetical protein